VETVGVRELKNHLSRHLKRVQGGARIVVTDRGRSIATLAPIESDDMDWAVKMVVSGRARWSGGKPKGARRPVRISGKPVSDAVLDDRR